MRGSLSPTPADDLAVVPNAADVGPTTGDGLEGAPGRVERHLVVGVDAPADDLAVLPDTA